MEFLQLHVLTPSCLQELPDVDRTDCPIFIRAEDAMSLYKILDKADGDHYSSMAQVKDDVKLIKDNARALSNLSKTTAGKNCFPAAVRQL